MRKLPLVALATVLIAICCHHGRAQAQGGAPSLVEIQRMIDSAQMLDPEIEKYMPRWKVQEADLRIKIVQYFKLDGQTVKDNDSIVITATFPNPETKEQDILSIRVGPSAVLSGTGNIRRNLGEGIYNQLLERNYAHAMIEPAKPATPTPPTRIGYVMEPGISRQFIAASAYKQVVLIGSTGARLEHWLGNDEIGYHFWSSGQGKGMISYPVVPLDNPELRAYGVPDILTVKIGLGYRLKIGANEDDFLGGIISPRKLNGSLGAKAVAQVEYRLPQLNDLGFAVRAEVPFNKFVPERTDVVNGGLVMDVRSPFSENGRPPFRDTVIAGYFLRTVAQGNVFWETWLNNFEHFFRVSLGGSYQEVGRAVVAIEQAGEFPEGEAPLIRHLVNRNPNAYPVGVIYDTLFHPTEVQDWIFAKVEYMNQSGFPFGMSAQLANRNLMLSGYIPVIPNWLFVEAKYSTPILRDNPAPWENRSFFMISPILRFAIGNN